MWVVVGLFAPLALTGSYGPWKTMAGDGEYRGRALMLVIAQWAVTIQAFMPIAFGVMLADRLPRDRRPGVGELFAAQPAPAGGRLIGKYLGSALATMAPIFLVYSAGIGYVLARSGDPMAIPMGLAGFVAINVPGLLFVGAFSIACPAVLWVPLYQVLFVGYWFWGNLLPPYVDIPSLTGTVLTPIGEYTANGFFDIVVTTVQDATVWGAVANIALLLGLAALALWCAHRYLLWREAYR